MKILEIQLFFSISIPFIVLKRNMDFKGTIVAKLLIRSHFLSL